ncbi:MAG TPA: nuclear transport factor 2 family protein [Chloroflexota bacterium]|nr:nuclear transport factor 2 family protein [Chloroflexota bacterium]
MNREQTEQEVEQLAQAWVAAELRGDIAFLEKILADTFVGVGPLGFLLTKQEWLARLQSGDLKYDALTLDEVKVRRYDEAAILIGRQTQEAAYRGNPVKAQLRTTLVFVHQEGQWHLAGLHFCTIGQPLPFARP